MDPVSVIVSAISGAVGSVFNFLAANQTRKGAEINQRTVWGQTIGQLRLADEMQETYTRIALILAGTIIVIFLIKAKK